ncbi:MAG: hypothetical protein OXI72_23765 [Gemmatimonadota bacterium]|nr:hypothetical protein [Gemmatimonadota bacterium]
MSKPKHGRGAAARREILPGGDHRRSLAETQIYRYNHLIGDKLKARSEANRQVESRLGCALLNRMIHLGKLYSNLPIPPPNAGIRFADETTEAVRQ